MDKWIKGISSEAEVRLAMGQADSEHVDDNGNRVLVYPSGPQGVRTWMFWIDQWGKLLDWQQVLTMANFDQVRQGMTRAQVARMLGRPRSMVPFVRMGEEVWDWKYVHVHEERLFNVHFDLQRGLVLRLSLSELAGA